MNEVFNKPTVILLINVRIEEEINFIRKWFRKSRFQSIEAENLFQAIEEKDDFTTFQRPQVILLKVNSMKEDYFRIRQLTQCFSDDNDISIMALSDSGRVINHKDCFEGNLSEIKLQLDKLMPNENRISLAV